MKMMTKEIEKAAPRLYETDGQGGDAVVVAHWFSVLNGWNWYMTEYEPETGVCFGLVDGIEEELGYFSVEEFEQVNEHMGFIAIERDMYWHPCKLSEVRR